MATDWLVTGAGGQLGSVLLRLLTRRGAAAVGTVSAGGPRPEAGETVPVNLLQSDKVTDLIKRLRPRFVIHSAAVTNLNDAFREPDTARRTNTETTAHLHRLAADLGARFIFISTDLVFDGSAAPYRESDTPTPLSVYGKTKAEAESLLEGSPVAVSLRLPLMYGIPAVDRPTTFMNQLRALLDRRELALFLDEFRSPLWLEDAARACVDVAQSDILGVLHAGGPERLSRLQMGERMAKAIGVTDARIRATAQAAVDAPELRPPDVSLDSSLFKSKFRRPAGGPMQEALAEIARELNAK